jgi:hypothetical protein
METIRAGKNTLYIDYTFDVDNTINQTQGFTLNFPSPTLNIKANNANISIAKLAFVNLNSNTMNASNLPLVNVRTSIPTSSCVQAFEGIPGNPFVPNPRSVTYSEAVMFDTMNQEAHMYNNYSANNVLCANPLSNTYNLKFYDFVSNDGTMTLANFQTQKVKMVLMTLKVELIEEEIF